MQVSGELSENVGTALLLQPDGKLFVAGQCVVNGIFYFCASRRSGGPFAARQCSFDIDGDGKVLATVDSLIGLRIAQGMRGSSVLNGVSFPNSAIRTGWDTIRDYLNSQCGMNIY